MEPFEHDELSPQELDDLLQEWQSPAPPPHLRAALFPEEPRPWWRRAWSMSVRIPLPVACCLLLMFGAAVWRVALPAPPPPPAFVPRTEPARSERGLTFNELRPVAELRPRIIRREDAKN